MKDDWGILLQQDLTPLDIIQKWNYSYGISYYVTVIILAEHYSGVHYYNGHYFVWSLLRRVITP